jgi:hypothetical protein
LAQGKIGLQAHPARGFETNARFSKKLESNKTYYSLYRKTRAALPKKVENNPESPIFHEADSRKLHRATGSLSARSPPPPASFVKKRCAYAIGSAPGLPPAGPCANLVVCAVIEAGHSLTASLAEQATGFRYIWLA